MKLKERLTYAVVKGINESFDIDDLGHEITSAQTKEKVAKHSKIYQQIQAFIDKGYPLKNTKRCYKMLTPEDIDILDFIYNNRDMLDDEVNALVVEHHLSELFETIYLEGMKNEISTRLKNKRKLTATEIEFIQKYASCIHSKDHPLYAFYAPSDKDELRRIIEKKVPRDANLNWIDVSGLSDMHYLFCNTNFNGDISLWDVSNIIGMQAMFWCSPFNGDISQWDVSEVITMKDMFNECDFNGDISGWNVSKVKHMSGMFAYSPFTGDISDWDVSSVRDMSGMFKESQFNGDISRWDVTRVRFMSEMFSESVFNGDISGWDVSKVEDMKEMFEGSQFTGDLSKWRFGSKMESMSRMFVGARFNGDISGWNVDNVKNMSMMFGFSKFDQDISGWVISDECMMNGMFYRSDMRDEFKPPIVLMIEKEIAKSQK